jgi:hypothetical protein
MEGRKRSWLAAALFAAYVAVVIATYALERQFWTTCIGEDDPYYFSNALLTLAVSGPLLTAVVAVAKFRPVWLWIAAMVVALLSGYTVCVKVLNAAHTGTPVTCT